MAGFQIRNKIQRAQVKKTKGTGLLISGINIVDKGLLKAMNLAKHTPQNIAGGPVITPPIMIGSAAFGASVGRTIKKRRKAKNPSNPRN